jgi:3-mercaptopyruvate sulfurtransferase SseA
LAAKAFLRARPIVLIDTGRAYAHLEGLCRLLRAAGFAEVSILDGGLNAWRAQVGALEGDAQARDALTAAEFSRLGFWGFRGAPALD